MRLDGKVVLVTGSCTGIGKAIAERAVAEGARVVVNGLERDLGEAVVAALSPDRSLLHIEDITADGAPDRLVQAAVDRFGRLDGLVNNAAMLDRSNLHTTDRALLQRMLEVNTIAPFLLIKAALPWLRKTRGSVLNIGSVNAWSGEPNLMAYSVSKGALMTLTRNLGDTLMREDGVRVNQINPGWVLDRARGRAQEGDGLSEDWYRNVPRVYAPAGRILWPAEIAAAVMYWLSDECGPISGQVLDLEQHPFIGRNPPKDASTIPAEPPGRGKGQ